MILSWSKLSSEIFFVWYESFIANWYAGKNKSSGYSPSMCSLSFYQHLTAQHQRNEVLKMIRVSFPLHSGKKIAFSSCNALQVPAQTQSLRAWLHGESQPGLKFCSAHRAEILLWLYAQFQPGRKTQISVRKFTEVRKHSKCACSRSFFGPGRNSVSITWDFFRFSGPFGRAEIHHVIRPWRWISTVGGFHISSLFYLRT